MKAAADMKLELIGNSLLSRQAMAYSEAIFSSLELIQIIVGGAKREISDFSKNVF